MKIAYFTHSLVSCWNHGNAHFQRGLLRELAKRGHKVIACEPEHGWSRRNLAAEHGDLAWQSVAAQLPEIDIKSYAERADVAPFLQGAHLVIVHEWTDPDVVAAIGAARRLGGRFTLLFHDTHHRAISDPGAMRRFQLDSYDGILAFGESLAAVYRGWGWGARAYVFHEAADTRLFKPARYDPVTRNGVGWIGNWGDDERSEEIKEYLLAPARAAGLPVDVYGVRYPRTASETLAEHGAKYRGWIANLSVPAAFARYQMTVHVPRRYYRTLLPGIPTIRVFEALACGIPLISAPWCDSENLFNSGRDYLVAGDAIEMERHMRAIASDCEFAAELARNGARSINDRHTCAHRADQLLSIAARLEPIAAEAI